MRANPGGTIADEDVIGRDALTDFLWSVLAHQSVVLTSERRIGKTSVVRRMAHQHPDGIVCFLRDVEGLRSPAEFIESVLDDAQPILSKKERAKLVALRLVEKLGGAEVADFKLPQLKIDWKAVLYAVFEDICSDERRTIIFFWDELPLFLYNVSVSSGAEEAMEFLDVLRSLRQRHPNLRMVFTGSVGMHQVIGKLRKSGYSNDPTNDMRTVEVAPLSPEDARFLARSLIDGERVTVIGDGAAISEAISSAAGRIPYYIHWLIARIANAGTEIDHEAVNHCLRELLTDPNDPAHFQYYAQRLTIYYAPREAEIALHALDALAFAERPISFGELLNAVRHKTAVVDEEALRGVLLMLQKDHYLIRTDQRAYAFRYSIVRDWWAYARS